MKTKGLVQAATGRPLRGLTLILMAAGLLAGCAAPSKPARQAPVVDRSPVPPATAAGIPAAAPAPGSENAGKPGYYTVRPGDTLYRIGLEHGQSWRDIAAWNGLTNPHVIEVGQVLRVVPPTASAAAVTTQPVASATVQARPLEAATPPAGTAGKGDADSAALASATPSSGAKPANAGAPAGATVASPAASPASGAAAAGSAAAAADAVSLIWPAKGPLLYSFDETRNKGIGIGGRAGDPVLAAADGRVVYAGSDLRGYGNLIILKHNNTYLTAYAHNQTLLVREDQTVRQGQQIAEMGSSDADRVKLHFEVRRQGKPVDPLRLLPAR
jgi:lipoprotein NlpD